MKKLTYLLATMLLAAAGSTALGNGPAGSWNGVLQVAPQAQLRLVFNFEEKGDGFFDFTLDSPDQGAKGIPGEVNLLTADSVNVSVPEIGLSYAARIEGNKMSGTFSQSGMRLPLELEHADKSESARLQTPQPPFPYAEEAVSFANKEADAVLAGTLLLPENFTADTPVVLMVTGSGPQNRDEELFGHKPFLVIADYLARQGIATLRYDDRGVGESTGDASQATTRDFAADAAAGVEYLRNVRGFRNVGVLGHSEGGAIAFMLGGDNWVPNAARPDFIVTLGAPAMRGDSILAAQNEVMLRGLGVPGEIAAEYAGALLKLYDLKSREGAQAAVSAVDKIAKDWSSDPMHRQLKGNLRQVAMVENKWLDYFTSNSPATAIAATKCPVLALYGDKDTQVLPSNAEQLLKLNPSAEVKLLPGLNHLLQPAQTGLTTEYESIPETISPQALALLPPFIHSTHK